MINGDRIKQARELRGLTQVELAERIDINRGALTHYEVGRYEPPDDVLDAIAQATGFPLAFFQQEMTLEFPLGSLLFRSRASMTSKDKLKAHRYGQTLYEIIDVMAKRFKEIPLRLPRQRIEPAAAAIIARSEMSLSSYKPIENLVNAAEKSGVRVLRIPEPLKGIDAFSVWAGFEDKRPVIIIAGEAPGDRLRFSIAHELGHLVMHQSIRGAMDTIEHEADQFAAELLMPAEQMQEELLPPVTINTLLELKERWGVSIQALIRRAYDLSIISERQYRYLCFQIGKQGMRTEEPIEIPIEKPRALRQMAEKLYGDPIDYLKMASHLKLPAMFVKQVVEAHAEKEPLVKKVAPAEEQTSKKERKVVPFAVRVNVRQSDETTLEDFNIGS
jgi:Zn-dependent peptidase ImmA (M78 family)/transcriptional regulator with XRE-family HTH domain